MTEFRNSECIMKINPELVASAFNRQFIWAQRISEPGNLTMPPDYGPDAFPELQACNNKPQDPGETLLMPSSMLQSRCNIPLRP